MTHSGPIKGPAVRGEWKNCPARLFETSAEVDGSAILWLAFISDTPGWAVFSTEQFHQVTKEATLMI